MPTLPPPVDGYPVLAREMGGTPEIAIFRRFANLNAQNLLYYQAQLTHLEHELRELEHKAQASSTPAPDGHSIPLKARYNTNWFFLELDPDNEHWALVLQIREVLEKYNAAVLQQVQMNTIFEPKKHDLRYLQTFLQNQIDCKGANGSLTGYDRSSWGCLNDNRTPDLLVLRSRSRVDPFTSWIADTCLHIFHKQLWCRIRSCLGLKSKDIVVKDSNLLRVTSLCTTIIASLLPVASIAILYCVHTMTTRIWLVACFTLIFSVAMSGITTALRSEIFAATAAFAAVQVVFIGTNVLPSTL